MIGCTKLLCGQATVAEAMREGQRPDMLAFSTSARPVVVWNLTSRCNLRCIHCYLEADAEQKGSELTTREAQALIKNLSELKIPVLLFSGGEPLLRENVFELGWIAHEAGLRPVLSTNGTLITREVARQIKESRFQYVGVSLDGLEETHDRFRARRGAFREALAGIRNSREAGLKTGVRFTLNRHNYQDLPGIIDLVVKEGIPRFCMYHLVYSGRGKGMVEDDLDNKSKREILDWLLKKTKELFAAGHKLEIMTVDNHADGVYLYHLVKSEQPEQQEEVYRLLQLHGGCSAGEKIANIAPLGEVYACQFFQDMPLGNVKEEPFSRIWQEDRLRSIREMKKNLKGRCGRCRYIDICGGCRIRAKVVYGDYLAQDPACYLTEDEIN